jgi:chromosome segregation ATPase
LDRVFGENESVKTANEVMNQRLHEIDNEKMKLDYEIKCKDNEILSGKKNCQTLEGIIKENLGELDRVRAQIDELKKIISDAGSEKDNLRGELKVAEARFETEKSRRATNEVDAGRLTSDFEKLKADLDASSAVMKKLEFDVTSLNSNVRNLTVENGDLRASLDSVKNDNANLKKTNKDLKAKIEAEKLISADLKNTIIQSNND